MNVVFDRKQLFDAVSFVMAASRANGMHAPHVCLSGDAEGKAWVESSQSVVAGFFVRLPIAARVEASGSAHVELAPLVKLLRSLAANTFITVAQDYNRGTHLLKVTAGQTHAELPLQDPPDAPQDVSSGSERVGAIDARLLADVLRRLAPLVGMHEKHAWLENVCIRPVRTDSGGTAAADIAACDATVLGLVQIPLTHALSTVVLFPRAMANLLPKFLAACGAEATLLSSESMVEVTAEDGRVLRWRCDTPAKDYVNARQYLPSNDGSCYARLHRADILRAVDRCAAFTTDLNASTMLTASSSEEMQLRASRLGGEALMEQVPTEEISGWPDGGISVNARKMHLLLNACAPEELLLRAGHPLDPVHWTFSDETIPGVLEGHALIMTLRI